MIKDRHTDLKMKIHFEKILRVHVGVVLIDLLDTIYIHAIKDFHNHNHAKKLVGEEQEFSIAFLLLLSHHQSSLLRNSSLNEIQADNRLVLVEVVEFQSLELFCDPFHTSLV